MSDHVGAKAISLVQRGGIYELERVRAFKAQGSDGSTRMVVFALTPDGSYRPTCTCEAGQHGQRCYHVAAARLLMRNERTGA